MIRVSLPRVAGSKLSVGPTIGLVLVLATGCGGGGGSRLSKSELDSKANAICAKYTDKIKAVGSPKSINDVPAYVAKVKPFVERGVDELARLKPPQDLQNTYDSWLKTQREALTEADQLRAAARQNDLGKVARLIRQLAERDKLGNRLAAQLGAQTCAKD